MMVSLAFCFLIFVSSVYCDVKRGSITTYCDYYNRTHYKINVGYYRYQQSAASDRAFLTVINSKCLETKKFCADYYVNEGVSIRSCNNPRTFPVNLTTVYQSMNIYISFDPNTEASLVTRSIALHEDPYICTWGYGLSNVISKCVAYDSIVRCVPPHTAAPTDYPTTPNHYLSLTYLVLLIIPVILLFMALKRIREVYLKRQADNSANINNTNVNVNTNVNGGGDINSIPLYDMSADNSQFQSKVQIFPEYPMMYSNDGNFNNMVNTNYAMNNSVDITQTLTPVYTQTYNYNH